MSAAESGAAQQVTLRDVMGAEVPAGPILHASPLQRGLEESSHPLGFLEGRLPDDFQLTFHFSGRKKEGHGKG